MNTVFIFVLLSQQWSTPVNLGIPGIDDMYPQVHRRQECWWSNDLCVVWQAFQNGNWEIYSRFSTGYPWSDTIRVTNDPLDDMHPSVTYDYIQYGFWCAWERAGDIYASHYDMISWSTPQAITSDAAIDELPSIFCRDGTTWVVWQRAIGDSLNIYSSYNSGSSWSPLIPVTLDQGSVNVMPRVQMKWSDFITVWERENDIYYSTYNGSSWQTPHAITNSLANDSAPDLTSSETNWVTVCWQSDESGNWEIYRTAVDTFTTHYRVTNNDSADVTPCPLLYTIPILQLGPMIVFSSNRNGNPDIFSWLDWTGPIPVDTHPAQDIHPVLTANGAVWIWALWQTDREGDWDICGSYQFCPGSVVEKSVGSDMSVCTATPNPFRSCTTIKLQIPSSRAQRNRNQDQRSKIQVGIYDISGHITKTLSLPATVGSRFVLSWDGTDRNGCRVPAGVYFLVLEYGNQKTTKKVILVR